MPSRTRSKATSSSRWTTAGSSAPPRPTAGRATSAPPTPRPRVGLQVRRDDISNGLYPTSDLERTGVIRQDDVGQLGTGLWGDTWIRFSDALRLNVGLRADYYGAEVEAFRPPNSGTADDWMLNPKLSLVYRPWASTELSFNVGSGFHSNDARGTTIRVDPVTGEAVEPGEPPRAGRGVDLGVRTYRSRGVPRHPHGLLARARLGAAVRRGRRHHRGEPPEPPRGRRVDELLAGQPRRGPGPRRDLDGRGVHRRRPDGEQHPRGHRDHGRGGGDGRATWDGGSGPCACAISRAVRSSRTAR